jgi:monovalent cation/hydrogen antiporter
MTIMTIMMIVIAASIVMAYQQLQREVLDAEREAVIGLRNRGEINDEVLHRIERELDLEEQRLAGEAGKT